MQTLNLVQPPENCPADMPVEAFNGQMDIIDVAIRFDEHENEVKTATSGELMREGTQKIVGHTACGHCVLLEDCRELSEVASENMGEEITHPVVLRQRLDTESVVSLWTNSVAIQAEHNGYSRESIANMLGTVTKLEAPFKKLIVDVLEQDSSHMPVALGRVQLPSGEHQLIEFEDVRVLVRKAAIDDLDNVPALTETLIQFVSRDENGHTMLRKSLETGHLPRKFITQLTGVKRVKEFRPDGPSSAKRGFGLLIGKNPNRSINKDIILIHSVTDAKGGIQATNAEAVRTEHALRKVSGEEIEMTIEESSSIRALKKIAG